MISFTCWKEQIPGAGEDAFPCVTEDSETVFLGVWDGLGGAGSRKIHWNGDLVSEARVAAEIASAFFGLFSPTELQKMPVASIVSELQTKLRSVLLNASGIKSKLLKRLPTTFAGIWLSKHYTDWQEATIRWAGDSRVYSLHPRFGLRQLTVDDVNPLQDAFSLLYSDGLITNCLSADHPFLLHETLLTKNDLIYPLFAISGGV